MTMAAFIISAAFWGALCLLAWTWAAYPAALVLFGWMRRPAERGEAPARGPTAARGAAQHHDDHSRVQRGARPARQAAELRRALLSR